MRRCKLAIALLAWLLRSAFTADLFNASCCSSVIFIHSLQFVGLVAIGRLLLCSPHAASLIEPLPTENNRERAWLSHHKQLALLTRIESASKTISPIPQAEKPAADTLEAPTKADNKKKPEFAVRFASVLCRKTRCE